MRRAVRHPIRRLGSIAVAGPRFVGCPDAKSRSGLVWSGTLGEAPCTELTFMRDIYHAP